MGKLKTYHKIRICMNIIRAGTALYTACTAYYYMRNARHIDMIYGAGYNMNSPAAAVVLLNQEWSPCSIMVGTWRAELSF